MATTEAERTVWRTLLDALAPPVRQSPSEWAAEHIRITDGDRIGRVRFDRGYEYQRDMMDLMFGDFAPGETRRRVVAYKGAQSGVTTICLAGELFLACARRVSVAHMMPRSFDADDKAKALGAFIDADPELTRLVPPGLQRVRQTVHGQKIRVCYSNSQAELKNWQAGAFVVDEFDECEHVEFDSIAMLLQRGGSYARRREIYIGTPTLPEFGIHLLWQASDQRLWFLVCPLCNADQTLTWQDNIRFETEARDGSKLSDESAAATAEMICSNCREPWDAKLRELANSRGEWRVTRPQGDLIGFGMNRLMVPASIPSKMVSDYLKGLRSDQAMREHVNQNEGRVYLPTTGKLSESVLQSATDDDLEWGQAPRGTVSITAGVDVQGATAPFTYVWQFHAYDSDGFCTIFEYGMGSAAELARRIEITGVHRGLVDISDGHHKLRVEELCEAVPCLAPARFDHYRKTQFGRGKTVKTKDGRYYALNRDDTLDAIMTRFFHTEERPRRVRVAVPHRRGLLSEWIEHHTKLARVKEERGGASGAVYTYRKLRPIDVDFPFAGALAEESYRQGGGSAPPGKAGGYGPTKRIQAQAPKEQRGAARGALRVSRKRRGSW